MLDGIGVDVVLEGRRYARVSGSTVAMLVVVRRIGVVMRPLGGGSGSLGGRGGRGR